MKWKKIARIVAIVLLSPIWLVAALMFIPWAVLYYGFNFFATTVAFALTGEWDW